MGVGAIIRGWDVSHPLFKIVSLDPPTFAVRNTSGFQHLFSASLSNPFHLIANATNSITGFYCYLLLTAARIRTRTYDAHTHTQKKSGQILANEVAVERLHTSQNISRFDYSGTR